MNSGRRDVGAHGDSTSDGSDIGGDDKHGKCDDGIGNGQHL